MSFDVPKKSNVTPGPAQSVIWRTFLRGLAIELEAQAGPNASHAILRGVGQRMAELLPLTAVGSLEALELEMNAVLAEIGWGWVQVRLHEPERCVLMIHTGLPHVGSAGEPAGNLACTGAGGALPGLDGEAAGRRRFVACQDRTL